MLKRLLVTVIIILCLCPSAHAFWVWTPETNKWVNPKFAVKETPQEQLAHALEFYNVQDFKKAIQEFRKLIKHYPRAREAAMAQFYIGQTLEQQGLLFKAFKEYQVVIEKYPFSEKSGEIVKRQYEIGMKMLEGQQEKNKVINTIVGGNHDVIDVFRAVIKNAPYGEFAAAAQYKIGLYLQEKHLYQESRDEFEKTMNDYPESEWAKAAKYQIALSDAKRSSEAQYDQKITQAAISEFEDFVKEYPDADLSQKAKSEIKKLREKEAENNFVVAKFYEKHKRYDAAKIYYKTIVNDYDNTSWATKALKKLQQLPTTN